MHRFESGSRLRIMAKPEQEKKEGSKTLTYAEMVGGVALIFVSSPVAVIAGAILFGKGAIEYFGMRRGGNKKQGQQQP